MVRVDAAGRPLAGNEVFVMQDPRLATRNLIFQEGFALLGVVAALLGQW